MFGDSINSLEQENSEFSRAFNYAQSLSAWRFRVPIWKYVLPTKKLLKAIETLDEFVYKIIDKAIARQEERERQINDESRNEDEGHATLLDHFLSYQKENNFVDREYLRSMLLNFLLAGRDTVWPTNTRLLSFYVQVQHEC